MRERLAAMRAKKDAEKDAGSDEIAVHIAGTAPEESSTMTEEHSKKSTQPVTLTERISASTVWASSA